MKKARNPKVQDGANRYLEALRRALELLLEMEELFCHNITFIK